MVDWPEIILRLGAATLTGTVLGVYLELHQKPTGMRTLGLVALASALAVLAVAAKGPDADASRVIRGVIAGVGFIGTGVILHRGAGRQVVHGLSTAATIWITAATVQIRHSARPHNTPKDGGTSRQMSLGSLTSDCEQST
jgi:putative Mg2+ transporter-C (MgtC) family protein